MLVNDSIPPKPNVTLKDLSLKHRLRKRKTLHQQAHASDFEDEQPYRVEKYL